MSDQKNTRLEIADGIARIIFDRPESSANIFDNETLDELNGHLEQIEKDSSIKSVLVTSDKDKIFVAGADINTLSTATKEEVSEFLEKGQSVFDRLSNLSVPTVAMIHGTALGGGLEVALACDYRVASADKATKLGLPETMLGILPAWGGSTRLPKLIGLPGALNMILKGSSVAAGKAKKLGLVDGVCPRERMEVLAQQFIKAGRAKRKSHWKTNNGVTATLIRKKVTGDVTAKTHGHYPAQLKAIDVVCDAVSQSHADSLANERKAALELADSPVTANLMRIFSLTESSKKAQSGDAEPRKVTKVCVVGAGVMGAGIAHWLSTRGVEVLLQDIAPAAIAKGLKSIEKLRGEMVKRRLLTKAEAAKCRDRILVTAQPVPLHSYDMVIEAAVENLEIKKKIFADLVKRTSDTTILATNTSALPITELAAADGITNPERIVGLHFFNPVHRMKLVEVVRAEQTSDEVVNTCLKLTQKIAKMPVLVQDSPGFVVNRILMPYLLEAGELFQQGIDPQEIDKAMFDFGMPMGPIRLMDEVGLDVGRHVADTMATAFPSRFSIPKILDTMVEAGQLGKKTKKGFYSYKGKKKLPNPDALKHRASTEKSMGRKEIADRLALLMVNEAYRCLEEGVSEDPNSIDFAMIMGAGFAPFRGGPIHYAETRGLNDVIETLKKFDAAAEGDRFAPAKRLLELAGESSDQKKAEAVAS